MHKISVIVGSYRPSHVLVRCISSLLKQTVTPHEIIVAVDELPGVEHPNCKVVAPNYKFVASGKKGVVAARNAACAKATGDILAFIDDDAIAPENWVEEIQFFFEFHPWNACVGGPVLPEYHGRSIPERWHWIIGCTGISRRPICCNMAVWKDAFEKMHGFPENLGRVRMNLSVGEETEFILNLQESGLRVAWCPRIKVWHDCPASRCELPYMMRRAYREGVGKAIIGKAHPLAQERAFLKDYLLHPDRYTVPVLVSVAAGYVRGKWG